MAGVIERHWYAPRPWLAVLLWPLSALFALLSSVRRMAYRAGLLRQARLPCPVVVVGNINVGGVGKTPLTLSLIESLQALDLRVGVVSRGYGGSRREPGLVRAGDTAGEVGDEPLLFAQSGVPVATGRDRVAAGALLLAAHPGLDLILSDDGLQHYRLARDLELAVLDGARGLGNGCLLPAGPLRERASRLSRVDALVVNGEATGPLPEVAGVPRFTMTFEAGEFFEVGRPDNRRQAADFAGERVVALAGIGHPERFFSTLASLGLRCDATLAFPDHHAFTAADLPQADALVVTTKDAVKLHGINHARLWALPVRARLSPDLARWIAAQLKLRDANGRKIS